MCCRIQARVKAAIVRFRNRAGAELVPVYRLCASDCASVARLVSGNPRAPRLPGSTPGGSAVVLRGVFSGPRPRNRREVLQQVPKSRRRTRATSRVPDRGYAKPAQRRPVGRPCWPMSAEGARAPSCSEQPLARASLGEPTKQMVAPPLPATCGVCFCPLLDCVTKK